MTVGMYYIILKNKKTKLAKVWVFFLDSKDILSNLV